MRIGTKEFDIKNRTYIMGILNVTPDSFSDGGKWNQLDRALFHAEEMIRDGADILDVGGESTRPGHMQITDDEETERVVPVIEALKKCFDIPLSIDTYKSRVASAALQAGADLVNDIWGCRYDNDMAAVIAAADVPCCLMHNRSEAVYEDFMKDMKQDLRMSLAIAEKAGILKEKIILDPGIGFGKTYEQNLTGIGRIEELKELGCPVLLGTSRKSVIAKALDLPVDERVEGTIATSVMAVMKGCAFVRVHDVKENARAVKMTEAIQRACQNG